MTIMTMPSSCLCHINHCRRAPYAFDQHVEASGAKGILQTVNHHDDNLVRQDARTPTPTRGGCISSWSTRSLVLHQPLQTDLIGLFVKVDALGRFVLPYAR